MKKCQGCHQEIDKYAIACQYCGKLTEEKHEKDDAPETEDDDKRPESDKEE